MDKSRDGQVIRTLYRDSVISIIIAAVAAMFGMLIDGIIISKFLGTDSMAAYGIVTPLFSIMTAISGVFATGSQVFCAKHLGAGRVDRAREVFSVCMYVTFLISVGIIVFLYLFCGPITIVMGARGTAAPLMPLCKDYLYGIAPGILPVLLLFIFNSLMRLDGDPNRVIWAVAAMTVFDIAGDLVNALVIHGGMLGMGISTAISYYIAIIIMLMHFRKKDIIFRFSMKDVHLADLGGILQTGAATAVGSVSTMLRNLILNNIMVAVAASTAVAALSVRNTLNTLFGSIMMGVGMTTAMISGIVYGEEDKHSAEHLLSISMRYALIIGGIQAVGIFLFASPLVALFSSGKEDAEIMAAYAVRAMRFYAFGLPLYGINQVFVNYLQGISRLKLANIVSFIDNFLYVIALSLILTPSMKTDGIWLAYPVSEALVVLTVWLAARHEHKAFPNSAAGLLFLPDVFGAPDEDIMEAAPATIEEVSAVSAELADFCRARGATRKETLLIPLCVEEMANNIIQHGFTGDSKKHLLELRVMKKPDAWIVRLRDNCIAFDPGKRAATFDPQDPAKHIGIRMIYGMASDIQYVNTMQLNNLIIKI